MLFAKVVLGLPVEGPFDYLVPEALKEKARPGTRCIVPFRERKMLGYVVGLSGRSNIKGIKPLSDVIDKTPVLDDNMLKLTRQVGQYYFCSWGEAIEAALPKGLRSPKTVDLVASREGANTADAALGHRVLLIHDPGGCRRWDTFLRKAGECLKAGRGVVFLSPQIESAIEAQSRLKAEFKRDVALLHSRQSAGEGLRQWQSIKNNRSDIVAGTRLAIFSPMRDLGLIVVDDEADYSYKQDQSPHYNAREAAFMRAKLEGAELLLADASPSLEMLHLAKRKKIEYAYIGVDRLPEVKIIDLARQGYAKGVRQLFSFSLQNMLARALEQKQKIVIFLNQRGFATSAMCPNCGKLIRCPRCNVNLVYHFKDNRLVCHYCNYHADAPRICPDCNAGYIRYCGAGTEKIESELSRLFPAAKITLADKQSEDPAGGCDIIVSTSFIFRHRPGDFDLVAVLSADNSLNRTDFRAAEKTFSVLMRLVGFNPGELAIQTFLPRHYCYQAVTGADPDSFYRQEIAFRKQLGFPPFSHMALVKIRGLKAERVREQAERLFEKLKGAAQGKAVNVISFFPGQPPKLRGSFYWQILLKSKSVEKINGFLKKHLKGFSHSGIIVTVDVDPV